jgi:type I restriction enzyme S subunit
MGRSCVYKGEYNICFQRSVSVLTTLILPEMLKVILDAPFTQNFMYANATGTAQKGFYLNQVESLVIPLPPIAEQHRIVAKIEELLPYVDRYAASWEKLEHFNAKFPEDMRKSILQYAIQGKLVEQRPEEGTAEELYQQIQAEKQKLIKEGKIKKEKPLAEIAESEIPFDIPESWKWVKLGEIVTVLGGKRIPAGRRLVSENTGHIYIRVSDMKENTVLINNLLYVPEDIYPSISKYIIKKEDVYITVAGTIGAVGTIPDILDGANLTENADRLVFRAIDKKWLVKCLQSALVQNQIVDATTKVGQPKLAIMRIQQLLIPLPPLAEQHRIVAKIEELLPYCDRLIEK